MGRRARSQKRNAKLRADPQAENRSGLWGREKGWRWVTREKLDDVCLHRGVIGMRIFHGRRIRFISCTPCRVRALISRSRRGAPGGVKPDVVILSVTDRRYRTW